MTNEIEQHQIADQVKADLAGRRDSWGADWRSIFRDSMSAMMGSKRHWWDATARVERAQETLRLAQLELADAQAALTVAHNEYEHDGQFTRLAFDTFKCSFDVAEEASRG